MAKHACAYCGASLVGWASDVENGGYWFCNTHCMEKFFKRQAGSGANNAASSSSAGSSSDSALAGAGIGLAAAGIGAAAAGVGAVAKGAGAALKGVGEGAGAAVKGVGTGVGELFKGVGKGVGAYGDLLKDGFKQSKDNTAYAQQIKDFEFSDDPETLDKEIFKIYQIAKSKSIDPRSMGTQPIARRKLLDEFQRLSVQNPELYKKYAAMHEEVKKIKPVLFFYIGGLALFFILISIISGVSSRPSKGETQEKERLNSIVQQIDKNISDKDYDTALYNASKLHWSYEPNSNWTEVKNWDSQREDLIKTINSLSGRTSSANATNESAESVTSDSVATDEVSE